MNAARQRNDKSGLRVTPARIGLWIAIAVMGVLATLQWWAKHNHQLATEKIAKILQDVDSGVRGNLSRQNALDLMKTSAITSKSESAVYRWRGPFSNYYLRLVFNEHGDLSWYDTLAPISPQMPETASLGENPTASQNWIDEPFYDRDEFLKNAVVPTSDERMPEALEKIRLLSNTAPTRPFASDSNTVIQSQYVNRRVRWYRLLLLDTFREHATKSPAWAEKAEAFLMNAAVELGNDRQLDGVYAQGCELLDLGCDDPLFLSLVVQNHRLKTHLQSKRGQDVPYKREILDSFLGSAYPPNVAYLAAYPLLDAADLLRLQDNKIPVGAEPKHDLFNVDKPMEMRLLYQHLVGQRKPPSGGMGPYSDLPRVLATQQTPPAWLKHMLVAAISTDSDPIRSSLLNAWYVLPENPEAPFEMFKQVFKDIQWAGYYPSFIGETADFWFYRTLEAQLDYPPAYSLYTRWLQRECLNYFQHPEHYAKQFMAHGLQCLQTGRFDTDVPLEFLRAAEHLMTITDPGTLYSASFRGKKYLGTTLVNENLDLLIKGYAEHPQYAQMLENYAVCTAYYSGNYDLATARLDALSVSPDPAVFGRCLVTPAEIRRAAELSRAQKPFDVGRQAAIRALTFTSDSSALICMAGDEQAYRFVLESGRTDERFESLPGAYPIFVAADNSNLLAYERSGIISQRNSETFAKRTELKLPTDFAGILASDVANGYWCTANTEAEGQGLTIHVRSAQDGHIAARVATPFQEIFNSHLAAAKPYVAITGFSLPKADRKAAITAGVWNFETGEPVFVGAPCNRFVDQVALTKNGDILVASGGELASFSGSGAPLYTVKTVNIETGIILNWYYHPVRVTCLLVLEDQNLLVTGCEDGVVRFFQFDTGKLLTKCIGHRHGISSLAISPDKKMIASGGNDGRILLWDLGEPFQPAQLQLSLLEQPLNSVVALAEDSDTGDILTYSRGEGSLRWRAATNYQTPEVMAAGTKVVTSSGRTFPVYAAIHDEISRQQVLVQTLAARGAGDESPMLQVLTVGHESTLFTPDGRSFIKSGNVVTVHNRDTDTPWPWGLLRGHTGPVTDMSVSANGRWLLTKSEQPDTQVRVWELPSDPTASDASIRSVMECKPVLGSGSWGTAISPDGGTFLLSDDVSYVQVWDTATGKMIKRVKGQTASFSPDGKWIALDGNNRNVLIYDAHSLEEHQSHPLTGGSPSLLQWSEDSQSLLYSVNGWISKIDRESGQDLLRKR